MQSARTPRPLSRMLPLKARERLTSRNLLAAILLVLFLDVIVRVGSLGSSSAAVRRTLVDKPSPSIASPEPQEAVRGGVVLDGVGDGEGDGGDGAGEGGEARDGAPGGGEAAGEGDPASPAAAVSADAESGLLVVAAAPIPPAPREGSTAGARGGGASASTSPAAGDVRASPDPAPFDPAAATAESDSCFARHEWVEPALDGFFQNARAESSRSTESVEEGLQRMHAIKWGSYTPGQDLVEISCSPEEGTCETKVTQASPANQPYKSKCILRPLRAAIASHQGGLAALLGARPLKLVIETEDFPILGVGSGARLPPFAMCASTSAVDVPVPDFTFGCYPETRYSRDSSWPAMHRLLSSKAKALHWGDRDDGLFQRSNWGVGPRQSLLPAIRDAVEKGEHLGGGGGGGTNGTDDADGGGGQPKHDPLAVLGGIRLDAEDTKFMASDQESYRRLEGWCDSKYALHTAGFSYSAALKYRLACGGAVFRVPSRWVEFYEPGVVAAGALVSLDPYEHDGGDPVRWVRDNLPRIREYVEATRGGDEPPKEATRGAAWVAEHLSPDGLSCYWWGALKRYAELYFAQPPPATREAAED